MDEKKEFTRKNVGQHVDQVRGQRSKRNQSRLEKLFESDWEVLVVERDGRTGEFRARTSNELDSTD